MVKTRTLLSFQIWSTTNKKKSRKKDFFDHDRARTKLLFQALSHNSQSLKKLKKKILNLNPQDEDNVDKDNGNDCNDRDDCKDGLYSIQASHANHVNRNQCSCCGTHKSLWNREICDQKKERNRDNWNREMCRRKREKYEFLNQRNMRWKSFECTVGKPLFFRAGRRAQSSPAGQPEAISSKCNPMKYCAPSPPPPLLSLFSCCEIKYVSEERAMGPRYRGNYQPGDGHCSAIGAVTGVGRIAALYRVCYDCGTLMYSSLIARVSLYYLVVLLSLFYNMFPFTHEKVELFTIVMPPSNIDQKWTFENHSNAIGSVVQRCIAEHWRGWFIPPWIPESPQASVSHCGILYTFPSFISMSSGYSVISAYTLYCYNFLYTFPLFISMSPGYSEHLACQGFNVTWLKVCALRCLLHSICKTEPTYGNKK